LLILAPNGLLPFFVIDDVSLVAGPAIANPEHNMSVNAAIGFNILILL